MMPWYSWHEGREQCLFDSIKSLVVDEERMRPDHSFFLDCGCVDGSVGTSCFLQCFETVGWVDSQLVENPCRLSQNVDLQNRCSKKDEGRTG